MTQYVDYSSRVPVDLRERALVAGIVDEAGDISRRCCTCNERRWGWMLHAASCPVYAYHNVGGVRAAHVLESILEEQIDCAGCGNEGSIALFRDKPGSGNDLCRACAKEAS